MLQVCAEPAGCGVIHVSYYRVALSRVEFGRFAKCQAPFIKGRIIGTSAIITTSTTINSGDKIR